VRRSVLKKIRKTKKQRKKKSRKKQARNRLEEATAAYFASLSGEALEDENMLAAALEEAASHVNFDG
jgi:hypothetical protein